MSRLVSLVKRVGWIVVIALVVVATAGGSLIAVLTARGLPTTHGTLAIAGLDDAVRVTRDANGIAWIEADSAHDLFLAQGYVHAQERMWQMEVWRHISAGRLSELFGPSALEPLSGSRPVRSCRGATCPFRVPAGRDQPTAELHAGGGDHDVQWNDGDNRDM